MELQTEQMNKLVDSVAQKILSQLQAQLQTTKRKQVVSIEPTPELKVLAETKLQRWTAKDTKGFMKPKIERYSKMGKTPVVVFSYNSYGKRIEKPYHIKQTKEGEKYLAKHKGKVVGKAI